MKPSLTKPSNDVIAVVCALQAEAQTLIMTHELVSPWVTGMGAVAVQRALAQRDADDTTERVLAVISWGVCGALAPDLKSGDVIVGTDVVNERGNRLACDPVSRRRLMDIISTRLPTKTVRAARLLSAEDVITKPSDKARLYADHNAVAVDMESFQVAEFAHLKGLPVLLVRAVADSAQCAIPNAVSFKPGQSKPDWRTVVGALSHPFQWSGLARTRAQFNAALTSLRAIAPGLSRDLFYRQSDATETSA